MLQKLFDKLYKIDLWKLYVTCYIGNDIIYRAIHDEVGYLFTFNLLFLICIILETIFRSR